MKQIVKRDDETDRNARMNPGSKWSEKSGCTCPVMDNNHGQGFPWGEMRCFWINEDCKLHGPQPDSTSIGMEELTNA